MVLYCGNCDNRIHYKLNKNIKIVDFNAEDDNLMEQLKNEVKNFSVSREKNSMGEMLLFVEVDGLIIQSGDKLFIKEDICIDVWDEDSFNLFFERAA